MTAIILAAIGVPGESELVAAAPQAGVVIARRSLDAADLVAAAAIDTSIPIVLTSTVSRISPDIVTRLSSGNRVVIGLATDEASARALLALGVVRIIHAHSDAAETMADLATEIATEITGVWGTGMWEEEPVTSGSRESGGQLIAVWAPPGAPGRTSVALGLADDSARNQRSACVVDADTYAPSICFCLGILEEASGIVVASRHADNGTLTPRSLRLSSSLLRDGLHVLGGLPQPDRWPDLRHSAAETLWSTCRETFDTTVIDVGPCLEQEGGLLHHGGASMLSTRRNAVAITALAQADALVAVTRPDALSMSRLLTHLPVIADLEPKLPVVLAVIESGHRRRGQSVEELIRAAGFPMPVRWIPWDPDGYRAALSKGALLSEVAPRSTVRKAMAALRRCVHEQMPGVMPGVKSDAA